MYSEKLVVKSKKHIFSTNPMASSSLCLDNDFINHLVHLAEADLRRNLCGLEPASRSYLTTGVHPPVRSSTSYACEQPDSRHAKQSSSSVSGGETPQVLFFGLSAFKAPGGAVAETSGCVGSGERSGIRGNPWRSGRHVVHNGETRVQDLDVSLDLLGFFM